MRQGSIESAGCVVKLPLAFSWGGVNPMDRADLFRVYEFGGAIRSLPLDREDLKVADLFAPLFQARTALETLLGNDPQAKVDVCRVAAVELKAAVDKLMEQYFTDKNTGHLTFPDDAKTALVAPWDAWNVRSALQNFEAVFRADMQIAATYWVPQRGAYSTRDLVDHFERSFLPELTGTIGLQALTEFRSAGRCFAFGLWTAAGYHSCRAVEAILRPYFCLITGLKDDNENRTWGKIIEEMEREGCPHKPGEKTLFYLRQLKDNERNPLMHVRVVLNEQDADLLLSGAKNVIVMMAREIEAIQNPPEEKTVASTLRTIAGGAA